MNAKMRTTFESMVILIAVTLSAVAQEVSIPDPGLNAAVRDALHKPAGPLTQQDLLTLTNLDAGNRSINTVAGLEAAGNLLVLSLFNNHLTNFDLPTELRNLAVLDLGFNALAN